MSSVKIYLTDRAFDDLEEIESYSHQRWGRKTTDEYLDDIESALARVAQHPGLLTSRDDLPAHLRFYRVNQHLLICDVSPSRILVLHIAHCRMDISGRLSKLEPTRREEVELLSRRLGLDEEP